MQLSVSVLVYIFFFLFFSFTVFFLFSFFANDQLFVHDVTQTTTGQLLPFSFDLTTSICRFISLDLQPCQSGSKGREGAGGGGAVVQKYIAPHGWSFSRRPETPHIHTHADAHAHTRWGRVRSLWRKLQTPQDAKLLEGIYNTYYIPWHPTHSLYGLAAYSALLLQQNACTININ